MNRILFLDDSFDTYPNHDFYWIIWKSCFGYQFQYNFLWEGFQ